MATFKATLAQSSIFAGVFSADGEFSTTFVAEQPFLESFESHGDFSASFDSGDDEFTSDFGIFYRGGDSDPYVGPYTFTPTQSTQTVLINGKTATQNITIDPIPSNYGLISYNGSSLKVS